MKTELTQFLIKERKKIIEVLAAIDTLIKIEENRNPFEFDFSPIDLLQVNEKTTLDIVGLPLFEFRGKLNNYIQKVNRKNNLNRKFKTRRSGDNSLNVIRIF